MFGGNTWGQLGLRFKPSARKPISVKGQYFSPWLDHIASNELFEFFNDFFV